MNAKAGRFRKVSKGHSMCSSFTLTADPDVVRAYFRYQNPATFPPRERISPTDPILITREDNPERRQSVLVRWGFVPHWVKDPDDFPLIINARAETLAEKPSFRTSLAHKRCLIPASGFFEWSGEKGKRLKHHITPKDKTPLAIAGLWDHWLGPDGSEFESAVIITVAANEDITPLHHRMPALLAPDQFDAWLDVKNTRAREAAGLLKPAPEGALEIADQPPPAKPARKGDEKGKTGKTDSKAAHNQGDLFKN